MENRGLDQDRDFLNSRRRILPETAGLEPAGLAGQLSQEFLLVHAVLEGFTAIDEDDRDFVVELAPKFGVSVYVDLLPGKSPPPRQLGQALFDYFAQVASLAGINHDAARLWHAGILARANGVFPVANHTKGRSNPFWEVWWLDHRFLPSNFSY
jgi:hypothetical protein